MRFVRALPSTSWGDGTSGPDDGPPRVHALLHRAKLPETVLTKADHVLVTTGPYRWMRHPLYAMGGALFVAVGLMSASWFILGVACLAVALIRVVIVPMEEQALVAKLGDEYARTGIGRAGWYLACPSGDIPRSRPGMALNVGDRLGHS